MRYKSYCPEEYFNSRKAILQGITSRGAECMDEQRQLAASNIRAGGERVIRLRNKHRTTSIHLEHVIENLREPGYINPAISVDLRQVERVVWANPSARGDTNKMNIKNLGVAVGNVTIYELNEAPQALLDLKPSRVELLSPILVLAYGFQTNYWGNNRDVLSGAIYHVALSWWKWNTLSDNIRCGEIVNTERVWSNDSAKLVGQVANINVKRSRLAHALEYNANIHPYIGGLAGL